MVPPFCNQRAPIFSQTTDSITKVNSKLSSKTFFIVFFFFSFSTFWDPETSPRKFSPKKVQMFEFWVSPCHISVKRVFPACSRAVPATFSSLLRQKLSSSSLHFCYQPGAVVLLVTITSMAKHTHSRVLGLLTNADSNKSFKNSFLCSFLSSGDGVGALQKKKVSQSCVMSSAHYPPPHVWVFFHLFHKKLPSSQHLWKDF